MIDCLIDDSILMVDLLNADNMMFAGDNKTDRCLFDISGIHEMGIKL